MKSNDYVSVDHLLAEVLATVNDIELKKGFSKGWYNSRIQDAMQELSIETFWLKVTKEFVIPENCQIKMPPNMFNIRQIYLYNGDICDPGQSQVVYFKRLFNNKYSGNGYTAKVKDDGSNSNDVYQPNQIYSSYNNIGFSRIKYYYGFDEEDGLIMLSRDCLGFSNVRIFFNAMGVPNGETPIIPRFFERAVVDYVKLKFYDAMKSRDVRTYRPLWVDAKDDLENLTTGSWNKARKRIKSMDSAEKESMEEYISSMYHK
jgi:hypothetical protein